VGFRSRLGIGVGVVYRSSVLERLTSLLGEVLEQLPDTRLQYYLKGVTTDDGAVTARCFVLYRLSLP